jgi:hypothetical protein
MTHGSCCQAYHVRVSTGRFLVQTIWQCTAIPDLLSAASSIVWRLLACQTYHADHGKTASESARRDSNA